MVGPRLPAHVKVLCAQTPHGPAPWSCGGSRLRPRGHRRRSEGADGRGGRRRLLRDMGVQGWVSSRLPRAVRGALACGAGRAGCGVGRLTVPAAFQRRPSLRPAARASPSARLLVGRVGARAGSRAVVAPCVCRVRKGCFLGGHVIPAIRTTSLSASKTVHGGKETEF